MVNPTIVELRRWAAGLSHHLAHVPSRGLRDLAKELRARLRV